MANFLQSVTYMLQNEGGFVDDPLDSGGATNMGITIQSLYAFRVQIAKKEDKENVPMPTKDDIKNLSTSEAMELYYEMYYRPLRLMFVHHNNIATAIMDMSVNMGRGQAVTIVHRALIRMLYDTGTDGGGRLDDVAIESLNKCDPSNFIDTFEVFVMQFYNGLVSKRPKDAKFLHGWSQRAGRLLTLR